MLINLSGMEVHLDYLTERLAEYGLTIVPKPGYCYVPSENRAVYEAVVARQQKKETP